jgi:hypothetical protein
VASLLKRAAGLLFAAGSAHASVLTAAEASDRHHWYLEADTAYIAASSAMRAWPAGGLGKLRHAEHDDGAIATRLFAEYRGRLSPSWHATLVADYVDDGASGIDVVEAFFDWRPVTTSRNRHAVRVGAFYPPLSLENGGRGWQSPCTYAYSALNTWLGEEVRPVGAEWTLRRRLGERGAADLRVFAAAFYGNDPAATLLFWRGWSLHDRQTRLGDVLSIPGQPVFGPQGAVLGLVPQNVEPVAEIDGRPGAYAGVEWRSGERLLVQVAYWDNRADPYAFRGGQWGWETAFSHVAIQVSLPLELGLVTQWMRGDTDWLSRAYADGSRGAASALVTDDFEARFALLTRLWRGVHRVTLRYDDFTIDREWSPASPALVADRGRAVTLAYRYVHSASIAAGVEWLEIRSRRDLWPFFYGLPARAVERSLQLRLDLKLAPRR